MTARKINLIIKELENNGLKATTTQVTKGGIVKTGIVVGEGVVRTTFYPDKFGEELTSKQIAKKIAETVEKTEIPDFNLDCVDSFENAKDMVEIRIRPVVEDNVVTRPYLDLEEFAAIVLDTNETGVSSIRVTKPILNHWNVTEEKVLAAARENTEKQIRVSSMAEILGKGMLQEMLQMGIPMDEAMEMMSQIMANDIPMYVATNKAKTNGAGAMTCTNVFRKFCEEKELKEVYILPSSIHEVLIVKGDGMSPRELKAMVQEVNGTEVEPEERLSDSVYKYILETNEIILVEDEPDDVDVEEDYLPFC